MQDTTQTIPTVQSVDSPQVSSTDSTFKRPAKKVIPLIGQDSLVKKQLHLAKAPVMVKDSMVSVPISTHASSQVKPAAAPPNLYHGHALVPVHRSAEPRQELSPIWFFPILIFSVGVITWLRLYYARYFRQIFQAFIKNNIANQIVRDENIVVQRASVLLSFTFNLIGAMFLYQVSLYQGWKIGGIGHGFDLFLFFAILVSSVYTLKFLILKTCGWLFNQDREMATYIFNTFLINHILGIVLIPLIALFAYNQLIPQKTILGITIVLISCAFIYRLFRGLLIGLAVPGFSALYLFLYLCTLEIAPLLVLARIIIL